MAMQDRTVTGRPAGAYSDHPPKPSDEAAIENFVKEHLNYEGPADRTRPARSPLLGEYSCSLFLLYDDNDNLANIAVRFCE
jgi:hypothetical protein